MFSGISKAAASSSTVFLLNSLVRNRLLLLEMTKRDISDRYAGQALGAIWAVVHPVAMIATFVFIFGVVFRAKLDGDLVFPGDHTLYMLSGIVPWLVIADVLGRSSTLIVSQANLVKQVVFPIEILPVKVVLSSLPTFLIGLAGILLYALFTGRMSAGLLLYPLAALPMYIALIGACFLLSAIGVFLRDTREIVQMYTMVGLYMAPIFYFIEWLPAAAQPFLYINPATIFVDAFHDSAYYGGVTNWGVWLATYVFAGLMFWVGASVFAKLKPHFGSHL